MRQMDNLSICTRNRWEPWHARPSLRQFTERCFAIHREVILMRNWHVNCVLLFEFEPNIP